MRVLSHEKQAYWRMGLQTALKWGMRPLVFFGVESEGPVTDTDRALMLALELYERSLCPDCRYPRELAYDPDLNGWFEVDDSVVCQACLAREQYVESMNKPEPGQKIAVVLDPAWEKRNQ